MDPELKAYLEQRFGAIEQHMATKTDLDSLRAEVRAGDEETRRHLETRIDAQGRGTRDAMADMETRLTKGIESRREDIDAIGADVVDLQARVKRLERPRTKPK